MIETSGTHPAIRQALIFLSQRCDGASSKDLKGFNGPDSNYGKSLAQQATSGELHPGQQFKALELLRKYKKQLKAGSIELFTKTELSAWLNRPENLEVEQVSIDGWVVRNPSKDTSKTVVVLYEERSFQCTCFQSYDCKHCQAVAMRFPDAFERIRLELLVDEEYVPQVEEVSSELATCEPEWMLEDRPLAIDVPSKSVEVFDGELLRGDELVVQPVKPWHSSKWREELSENQKQAFDLVHEWYSADQVEHFVLRGYAGTGKTFTLQRILHSLREHHPGIKIAICAPTHKAVHVIQEMAREAGLKNACVSTLHSLLRVAPSRNYDEHGRQKLEMLWNNSQEPYYGEFDLVCIDEASMVGDQLMEFINLQNNSKWRGTYRSTLKERLWSKYGEYCSHKDWFQEALRRIEEIRDVTPTLFLGDPAQLPPIEEGKIQTPDEDLEQSPVFNLPEGIELTQVMRYDGEILNYATELRKDIKAEKPPTLKAGSNISVYYNKDDWQAKLIEAFQYADSDDPYAVKALAWTNKRVKEINDRVRDAIFQVDDPFVPGERLTARDSIFRITPYDEMIVMRSCAECVVENLRLAEDHMSGVFGDEKISVYRLDVLTDSDTRLTIDLVHPSSKDVIKKQFDQWVEWILSHDPKMRSSLWKRYYQEMQRLNLMKKGKEYLDRLQYSYALTIHQAQGGTYKQVFMDVANIQGSRKDPELRNRLLYVASTRASSHLSGLMRY